MSVDERTMVDEVDVMSDSAICPYCGEILAHFSGLEEIPEFLYCPKCLDKAFDYDGTVLFLLI